MNSKKDPSKHIGTSIHVLRKKIQDLKERRKYEEALLLESEIEQIEKNRGSENHWVDKGLYFRHMGKFEESLQCFDKDIQANNSSYYGHFEKGVTLYSMEHYDEALECFFKAHELEYSNVHRNSFLVKSLKSHKKLEDVLTRSTVDKSDLKEHHLQYFLASTLYKLKRYSESVTHFSKAAMTKPDDSETLYGWAKSELMLNKPGKCLELLEKACTLDLSMGRLLRIDPVLASLSDNEKFKMLCKDN